VHRRLLFCLVVLLLSAALAAQAEQAKVPPAPARWLNDDAGMLSEQTRRKLDAELEAYERATGHQVVVWITNTIGQTPLDDFATSVFQAWKIGRKKHDDGVLLLVVFGARMPEHWGQAKEREWLPDWMLVGSHILHRGERSSGPAHAI